FIMHGPDGADYKNESVFVEVGKPGRIVFDHVSAPRFRMTITHDDRAGKTAITWRMLFESAGVCDALKPICVPANEQNFDRLEAELARMSDAVAGVSDPGYNTAGKPFVISRVFDVPRNLVWKAWTERDRL